MTEDIASSSSSFTNIINKYKFSERVLSKVWKWAKAISNIDEEKYNLETIENKSDSSMTN